MERRRRCCLVRGFRDLWADMRSLRMAPCVKMIFKPCRQNTLGRSSLDFVPGRSDGMARSARLQENIRTAIRKRSCWIWPHRAAIPTAGLQRPKMWGSLIWHGNSPERGEPIPRTLRRASRDLLERDAPFCMQVGQLAIQRILEGYGYELTAADVIDAYNHFMAAAQKVDIAAQARAGMLAIATQAQQSGDPFSYILISQCSPDPQVRAVPVKATRGQRTWTKRSMTRR